MSNNCILIAEDDHHLQRLFAKALRAAGHDIHLANTGAEVLDFLENCLPSILLLDLGLPDVNGLEVLSQIRQHDPHNHIKVIVSTGNHLAETLDEMQHADLFLLKPINIHELVRFVDRLSPAYA